MHSDGVLINKQQQQLPPKELAVLICLLESAGELVSKEALLNRVWPNQDVNEESLTRCIYALRRILQENKTNRYIETAYGKGYRFCRPVTSMNRQIAHNHNCTLAILPFRLHDALNTCGLHDTLIEGLARYTDLGLVVLPAAITHNCHDALQIITLMDKLRPDYYLAGQTQIHHDGWQVRMELVKAEGHHLIHHDTLTLTADQSIPQLQQWLENILFKYLPRIQQYALPNPEHIKYDDLNDNCPQPQRPTFQVIATDPQRSTGVMA
ncbi:MAG: winged helix-turn-helix domain-containing protein [Plesiomonas sp.]|uniref:winged helix-turn-helix domain-containing protein n=1 Tax=Plesiomonas sp. TaxID=2486279 RepID=UPI003F3C92F8